MIEVGHCKECCKKYDTWNKCNPNSPLIKHLKKDKCPFCEDDFDWEAFRRYTEECEDYLEFPEDQQPKYKTMSDFKKKKKSRVI